METLVSLPSVRVATELGCGVLAQKSRNCTPVAACPFFKGNIFQSNAGVFRTGSRLPSRQFSSVAKRGAPQHLRLVASQAQKWVLQPAGDGDSSHLDEKVPVPGPIEMTYDAAVVGREAEKADIILPIATVSGRHARLEKKGSKLYVTDLDSTNGTWIGGRQLRPGSVTEISPGTFVTFGDEHLAQFRVELIEEIAVATESNAGSA